MKLRYFLLLHTIFLFFTSNAQTYISGYITEDTYWAPEGSPYIITDSLIVSEGAYLDLQPDVIVMFKYYASESKKSYIVVNGGMGTYGLINGVEHPVIFTSERDDSYGDFNGDGKATIPKPGDWGYIRFNEDNPGGNEYILDHAIFKYGGGKRMAGNHPEGIYPMVSVCDQPEGYSKKDIRNCQFLYSKGTGIVLGGAILNYSTVSNCYLGVMLTSSGSDISFSSIINNTLYPVYTNNFKVVDYSGNSSFMYDFRENIIENNGENYIALAGTISALNPGITTQFTLNKLSLPYLITAPLLIKDQDINIENGTLIKFKYYSEVSKKPYILLDSLSILTAPASVNNQKTVFTSEYDHKYDYELYEGSNPSPKAGDWGYIEGSRFSLYDCVFKYGGIYSNRETHTISYDSSAVIRLVPGNSGTSAFNKCLFNSVYNNGINGIYRAHVTDHPVNIENTSFLIDKQSSGIEILEDNPENSNIISATNNYWYGSLGPHNADSNAIGNGCKVGNNIYFKPFLKSSDDELSLVSSVISGIVKNTEGKTVSGALVKLKGKNDRSVYANNNGYYYISNVYPGYGYVIEVFAPKHKDTVLTNINILKDTSYVTNITLVPKKVNYLVDTITFNVNPKISEVQVGGSAFRYYKIIDKKTLDPVYGAEVFVSGLVDTFYTDEGGIVTINIPASKVGSYPASKYFYISQVGSESLPYPPQDRMYFRVNVQPREYEKMWGGKLWLKEGISIVEFNQEAAAGIGLVVQDKGKGEEATNLIIQRGSKAGVGINLSASAKAKIGPVEAGAEAEIGVNINGVMEDKFIFDYQNTSGQYALAKFITLAGAAFPYLDSPLHRYLGCALLDENLTRPKKSLQFYI